MQVLPGPEGTLGFQVHQDGVLMELGVMMVFQGALEPKVSLERFLEPQVEIQDRMVYLESPETRASVGLLDRLDFPVGLRWGN